MNRFLFYWLIHWFNDKMSVDRAMRYPPILWCVWYATTICLPVYTVFPGRGAGKLVAGASAVACLSGRNREVSSGRGQIFGWPRGINRSNRSAPEASSWSVRHWTHIVKDTGDCFGWNLHVLHPEIYIKHHVSVGKGILKIWIIHHLQHGWNLESPRYARHGRDENMSLCAVYTGFRDEFFTTRYLILQNAASIKC